MDQNSGIGNNNHPYTVLTLPELCAAEQALKLLLLWFLAVLLIIEGDGNIQLP